MAEEVDEGQEPQEPVAKKGGGIAKIAVPVLIVIVAGVGGFATFRFVIAPMLATSDEVHIDEPASELPVTPTMVVLESSFVNVIREGDLPASTLLFGVTLECNNQATADLINAYLPRIIDMINKLHDSRTRAELDDVLVLKESIQRQALQKCNDVLKRLQPKPDPAIKVTAVFHHSFAVQDSM